MAFKGIGNQNKNTSSGNSLTGKIIEYSSLAASIVIGQPFTATGGTIVDSGGYRMHFFTSTGPFSAIGGVQGGTTVEYVVVAGGGGGGYAYPGTRGTDGDISSFNGVDAAGGGGGGSNGFYTGNNGGSGGGGGGGPSGTGGDGNTPPVSPSQGNPGFNATDAYPGGDWQGGGGGGAGSGGPKTTVNTNGGVGVAVPWVPVDYGTPGPTPGRWFAGGGAGAGPHPATAGAGGGGGKGTSGTTNTGGGGGGYDPGGPDRYGAGGGGAGGYRTGSMNITPGGYTVTVGGGGAGGQPSSGTGGSGIVIIRYLT